MSERFLDKILDNHLAVAKVGVYQSIPNADTITPDQARDKANKVKAALAEHNIGATTDEIVARLDENELYVTLNVYLHISETLLPDQQPLLIQRYLQSRTNWGQIRRVKAVRCPVESDHKHKPILFIERLFPKWMISSITISSSIPGVPCTPKTTFKRPVNIKQNIKPTPKSGFYCDGINYSVRIK